MNIFVTCVCGYPMIKQNMPYIWQVFLSKQGFNIPLPFQFWLGVLVVTLPTQPAFQIWRKRPFYGSDTFWSVDRNTELPLKYVQNVPLIIYSVPLHFLVVALLCFESECATLICMLQVFLLTVVEILRLTQRQCGKPGGCFTTFGELPN